MTKRKRYDNKNLSGWSISPEVLDFLLKNLDKKDTILEFGSGLGSKEISILIYGQLSII